MSGEAELTASEAARRIADGDLSAEALVEACLARIAEDEPRVEAWAHLDPDHARVQARARDAERAAGRPLGPLHGIPVGIKDIFDTWDMPTENGAAIHAGRQPSADARAVSLLRAAGAVILGKTVTTEFAFRNPGKTRNPHNPAHTPGGSSSGSAAAVAAGMVPLAIGSQTTGSVVRPAAFCGVVGFKPSHGLIPRTGCFRLSRRLDHVGVFARTVEDAALIAEALVAHDPDDPDTRPRARPRLAATAAAAPPSPPRLAFVRSPVWDLAEDSTRTAFAGLTEALGGAVEEVALGAEFAAMYDHHQAVLYADMALNLGPLYDRDRASLSEPVVRAIERGRTTTAVAYNEALDWRERLYAGVEEILGRFDAILTPAAPGPAPAGLASTGNPIFCALWTFCGMPAVSLPILADDAGMPIGAQLVGRQLDDARLLRTASWLAERAGYPG